MCLRARASCTAAFARGNLGKAKRLAESEDFRQSYEQILNILKNIRQMDISQLLDAIKRLKDENMDPARVSGHYAGVVPGWSDV